LVYSLASRRRDLPLPPPAKEHKRFAILIPAYREDAVIHECVHSCLEQDYPADCFDTVVISDRMQPETNASLAVLPVRLVEVHFEKSTKSKSLNAAMTAISNNITINFTMLFLAAIRLFLPSSDRYRRKNLMN
jgi:cellulose synthase/poly-beta-1,6-N-acetylglucosamine synthase-like glycosyltransferase